MMPFMRRNRMWGMATLLVVVFAAMPSAALAQEVLATMAAPATVPATVSRPNVLITGSRPGISTANTMTFRFENASVDEVLAEMSARFGFILIKPQSLPNLVTVRVPTPVHADEAVILLNEFLVPLGYAPRETHSGEGTDARTCLRIVGLTEGKRPKIPVFQGRDPEKIPLSNDIITQVIPLQYVDATRMRNDLAPFLSADADVTANSGNLLVITDTSARVRRVVEIIVTMDTSAAARPKRESIPTGNGQR